MCVNGMLMCLVEGYVKIMIVGCSLVVGYL